VPPLDSVPWILEKNRMLQAAGSLGMLLPNGYGPAVESVVSNPGLRYPVVVKPVKAGEFSSKLAGEGIAGEVFDVIPGPDSHIHAYCVYMDRHVEPLAECTIRELRQSPQKRRIGP
jgi:predicted ATP-grasp superfamily ATP-dependent carboligase